MRQDTIALAARAVVVQERIEKIERLLKVVVNDVNDLVDAAWDVAIEDDRVYVHHERGVEL